MPISPEEDVTAKVTEPSARTKAEIAYGTLAEWDPDSERMVLPERYKNMSEDDMYTIALTQRLIFRNKKPPKEDNGTV